MRRQICICDTQVHDVDELKQRLTKVWRGLGQSVVDDAVKKWHKRLWACVHVKGGHFKHLVWFKSNTNVKKQIYGIELNVSRELL